MLFHFIDMNALVREHTGATWPDRLVAHFLYLRGSNTLTSDSIRLGVGNPPRLDSNDSPFSKGNIEVLTLAFRSPLRVRDPVGHCGEQGDFRPSVVA
jgi:hypothetical protein